jgi:hypothetical protein
MAVEKSAQGLEAAWFVVDTVPAVASWSAVLLG